MSHPKHKLCMILSDHESKTGDEQETETTETDTDDSEQEVWQFDPGICG